MVKRLISANASEIKKFTKEELKESIKASEGRVVLSENVVVESSIIGEITTSEIAKSMGADMILLNLIDVFEPFISGLRMPEGQENQIIHRLKELTGLPIGLNLEPVDENIDTLGDNYTISKGRRALPESLKKANELGFDFLVLTGNPGTGVSNDKINQTIKIAKKYFNGLIFAGKMHAAGVNEPVVNLDYLEKFIQSGADVLLVPAVGTVPGVSPEEIKGAVELAHKNNGLIMSTIGTSQEGADPQTIRQIALQSKILGIDIQHIGDANCGLVGLRNITVLSDTIRGARHTVSRIARSINR